MLLHRMEAKTKSGTFLAESCGRASDPLSGLMRAELMHHNSLKINILDVDIMGLPVLFTKNLSTVNVQ